MFTVFSQKFDKKVRASGRKVILVNASCHTMSREEFTNIKHRFPPNMTARILPLDAGIIQATKPLYRAALAWHYFYCASKQLPQTVDLRWCLMELRLVWDVLSGSAIAICWCYTGILSDQDSDRDYCSKDDISLVRLREFLKEAGAADPESAAQQFHNSGQEAKVEES